MRMMSHAAVDVSTFSMSLVVRMEALKMPTAITASMPSLTPCPVTMRALSVMNA